MTENKDLKENEYGERKYLIWKVIGFIVLFHVGVYMKIYYGNQFDKVESTAKPYMVAASTINSLYIYPLARFLGYDNITIKPLYSLRDYVYDKGINTIDKKDGEREMWWFIIIYPTFSNFVKKKAFKLLKQKNISEEELDKCLIWTEEVYKHIKPLAKKPIKNNQLRSRRYSTFVGVLAVYDFTRFASKTRQGKLIGIEHNYVLNKEEISRLENLLNLLLQQIKYTKEMEPEGYRYFQEKTLRFYEDELVLHHFSNTIIKFKIHQNASLNCTENIIKIFGDSRKQLRDYLLNPETPIKDKKRINKGAAGIGPYHKKLYELCPDNPHLRLLKNDIDFYKDKIPVNSEKDFVSPELN